MSVHNTMNRGASRFSRREFLTASCLGVCGAGLGLGTQRLMASQAAKPAELPNIDPGYVGPQFFDKREEEALREVLESGSPFRYWGPGRPEKVLRFEEAFAKYMGARFALAVTSGTAALDCAVAGLGIGPMNQQQIDPNVA